MPEHAAHPGFNQRPSAPGRLRLNVTSDPANLAAVRHACEAFCVQCGLDVTAAGDVGLCVNEAMANVIRHAYLGATDRPIDVAGWCDEAAVYVSVRDWGTGQVPKLRSKRDPLTPGGLGMVCLRELLDDVVYEPQPDGMLLTMTKRKS